MKNLSLVALFIFNNLLGHAAVHSFAQWGNLPKGKYAVGYKDTVILKTGEPFSFYNYSGPKPFFVCIWYPATDNPSSGFMKYENYFDFARQDSYGQVYDSVIEMFHNITINDGVCINISKNAQEVKFEADQKNLYRDIMGTSVAAKRNLHALKQRFPCIVYHHGNYSTPFDNNVFCEYMASQGYVVVSACYQLPRVKDAAPLNLEAHQRNTLNDFAFMLEITKGMHNVDTSKMIAAGHSWGAQTELKYDNTEAKKSFKEIISFHTTIEDKSLDATKDGWPDFTYLIGNNCKLSTTPSVLFAPFNLADLWDVDTVTGKETFIKTDTLYPKYRAFRCNKTTPYTFVTVHYNLTHDGFITLGNLRMPYIDKYKLADKKEIVSEQFYYEQVILLAAQTIMAAINNSKLPELKNDNFKIESVNVVKK